MTQSQDREPGKEHAGTNADGPTPTGRGTKTRNPKLLLTTLALTLVAVLTIGVVIYRNTQDKPLESLDSSINGYRSVGYFVQWGIYARDFHVKDLDTSGHAAKLTHVNYAFGNVHPEEHTCFMVTEGGKGDSWADYGKRYKADESVSGEEDTTDQALAGNFNQLRQLKEKYPDLRVLISLGGWTWSRSFSDAAATPESREKFVESCIDLYIKGNLPVQNGHGGEGAAAGIFDGVDLDWEWPATNSGHPNNSVDLENDKANFAALIKEFRRQLDEYGQTTGKRYLLTGFAPANLNDIEAGGWNDPENFKYLDFLNVQGYDLHGTWDPTLAGHQANMYPDAASTQSAGTHASVDGAMRAYLDAGIDPQQLLLGFPMYGRGWQGVTDGGATNGAWAKATGAAPGTYEAGYEDYEVLKNFGQAYYDEEIQATWRWDGDQWWTLDDPKTVTQKSQYILDNKLGGGFFWELDGDRNAELTTALVDVLREAAPGPVS